MTSTVDPQGEKLYSAFGLTIGSELAYPGLPAEGGTPDVTIRNGPVAEELSDCVDRGVCFQTAPGRALVRVKGVGRFLVSDGREIVVDRTEGICDDELRVFVFGTCFGVLLQQRGELVLHATAVAREGGAVALAGPSGVGKTTLASALLKRGWELVADELTLVSTATDGTPLAVPGAPALHLWRSALDRLDLWSDDLSPARPGIEKYELSAGDAFAKGPERLAHVFRLTRWNRDEIACESLSGFDRFRTFLDNTFREPYLSGLGLARQRQAHCRAVVPRVPVSRLSWPHRWTDLDEAVDRIEDRALPDLGAASDPPIMHLREAHAE